MNMDYSKLSAYIDGELSPDELIEIQQLLNNDDHFAAEYKLLKSADIAASSDFDSMLVAKLSSCLISQILSADLKYSDFTKKES